MMSFHCSRLYLLSATIALFCAILFASMGFGQSMPCLPVLSNKDAVSQLPKLSPEIDSSHELPIWAVALSHNLPYTTAAMLELDYKIRSAPPELLRLYALARLAASQVHHCEYGIAYAHADLKRAGAQELVGATEQGAQSLPELEARVYEFARQMTIAGRDATDDQVAQLHHDLGSDALVGLVLNIGYANFQNRIVLALRLAVEANGPLAPYEWKFADSTPSGSNTPSAERRDYSSVEVTKHSNMVADAWKDLSFDNLQSNLNNQRERKPRIQVPEWEQIKSRLPQGLYPKPLRIRWSRVVVGYQPVVGPAWIKCLRVFEQEAHQNRVFEESIFWIVTRGLRCYYCMGHCEMLMQEGGLTSEQIAQRTARLATGNWDSFTPNEQSAFQFAYKLANTPTDMQCSDLETLCATFGDARALDCVWWSSRCHFMTKVSDAFQLQLETENVFMD